METRTVQEEKAVLSTNKKSVPFHVGEWPFSVGAVFIFISVSFHSSDSIHTIALIQGGFFSSAPKTHSGQDNGPKSVAKTCNHIIDSSLACPFCQSIIQYALNLWPQKTILTFRQKGSSESHVINSSSFSGQPNILF